MTQEEESDPLIYILRLVIISSCSRDRKSTDHSILSGYFDLLAKTHPGTAGHWMRRTVDSFTKSTKPLLITLLSPSTKHQWRQLKHAAVDITRSELKREN